MKLNTIFLVTIYSIVLLCSNVLGLNLRRDNQLTLSSSVQSEPEVIDINSLPSGDINQGSDSVSFGGVEQNEMSGNRSSNEFHVDNTTNQYNINENPTIINNENNTQIQNSTSEVIDNQQENKTEEVQNTTSETIVANKTEETPKEVTPTPETPIPEDKPAEEQVISNTDLTNKTEVSEQPKNETVPEQGGNTYTNNPNSTPKVEENKNETKAITPSPVPETPKKNSTTLPEAPKKNITIPENKTETPAPVPSTPEESSSQLINDTSSVQNTTTPEVIDNKNNTEITPAVPEIKNETAPVEPIKNETTQIEPITPIIPDVKNETKPEGVKNETTVSIPETKNETTVIIPETKNETKNETETVTPIEPLKPESPNNETKEESKVEPTKNETATPSEPLIPESPKNETNTTKEEPKNQTIPSEPKKPEIIYEPVEIVKEISPAGKAALEMETIKDPEYLSIISKGYENPTYTTNIFAKHPTGVSVAATQSYLWKPNDQTDANLWQNVEYNKYQNQLLDTSRYSTPAHFTVTEVGTPIVNAPSNSGLTIVTRVPQTITTTTTVPML